MRISILTSLCCSCITLTPKFKMAATAILKSQRLKQKASIHVWTHFSRETDPVDFISDISLLFVPHFDPKIQGGNNSVERKLNTCSAAPLNITHSAGEGDPKISARIGATKTKFSVHSTFMENSPNSGQQFCRWHQSRSREIKFQILRKIVFLFDTLSCLTYCSNWLATVHGNLSLVKIGHHYKRSCWVTEMYRYRSNVVHELSFCASYVDGDFNYWLNYVRRVTLGQDMSCQVRIML